jgi:hypothetical protein
MNNASKAYYQALVALKNYDYTAASAFFKSAENQFADSLEFRILKETTDLLLAVKEEISELELEKVEA